MHLVLCENFANIVSTPVRCERTNLLVTLLHHTEIAVISFSLCLSSCEVHKKGKQTHLPLVPGCTARSPSSSSVSTWLGFLHFWQIRLVLTAVYFSWYENAFSSFVRSLSFTVLCSCHCQVTSEISLWSLLPFVNILYVICSSTSKIFSCFLELQPTGNFQSKMLHFKIKLSANC